MTVITYPSPIVRSVGVRADQLLALHAADPQRFPALLESTASSRAGGRYDILFASPQSQLTLRSDSQVSWNGTVTDASFLAALDQWYQRERLPRSAGITLPFTGGWLLYLGYELAQHVEPSLRLPHSPDVLVAAAIRVPAAILRDRISGAGWIVAESDHGALVADLERALRSAVLKPEAADLGAGVIHEEDAQLFLAAIERVQEHIRDGDIYQANLSRRWSMELNHGIADVYRRLRWLNPAPFSAVVQLEGLALASSSPERLLRVDDGWISTRPIAGTRPRAANTEQDQALICELQAHPKERAEHIMLIDLERNDIGKLSRPGTVHVDEYMSIETYAHVHHIVSNIRGQLRSETTPAQILTAVFPGGTITGCPKIRCMQVIADLEGCGRGPYTGSLGYLNRDGSMDLNILIRTLELRDKRLSFRAGAGIVADSIAARELDETRAKARGLLQALI